MTPIFLFFRTHRAVIFWGDAIHNEILVTLSTALVLRNNKSVNWSKDRRMRCYPRRPAFHCRPCNCNMSTYEDSYWMPAPVNAKRDNRFENRQTSASINNMIPAGNLERKTAVEPVSISTCYFCLTKSIWLAKGRSLLQFCKMPPILIYCRIFAVPSKLLWVSPEHY